MGLIRPYDTVLSPRLYGKKRYNISLLNAGGIKTYARAEEGEANSMRIWQPSQDALAMLDGFSYTSAPGMLASLIDADDDGVRGHVIPTGTLKIDYTGVLAAQTRIYGHWSLGLYVPFYATSLRDVYWCDETKSNTLEDMRVRNYLTQRLATVTRELGDLDIGPWKRSGLGDMVLTGQWSSDFPQSKPFLRNVYIALFGGLSIPTGKREDFDKLLAFSYGYDGSWAVPMGLGIELTLSNHLAIGADVQLVVIFGNTRMRRIKTAEHQTDLLLLQKAPVYRDAGLDQCFNLYAQLSPLRGVSLLFGYQYYKHGEDVYNIHDNRFSSNIANSAERLQDWTAHYFVIDAGYCYHRTYEQYIIPEVSFFFRAPFNGRRSVMQATIGCNVAFNF